jgi:hypothetical protein
MSLPDRVRAAAGASAPGRPPAPPGSAGAAANGFDHVEVPSRHGQPGQRLSKRQFEALPLQERVGLLVQGTLRFYRGEREVAASEAMRAAY